MASGKTIPADVVIIGGGLLGCAVAYRLSSRAGIGRIVVLEKEAELSQHQSGRNSGVIHSGIYYAPGSQKAENCREGRQQLIEFCDEEKIAYDICGKVIVATHDRERPILRQIHERGLTNNVESHLLTASELTRREPGASGVEALFVPSAGIIDFRSVCCRLGRRIESAGHQIIRGAHVRRISEETGSISVECSDIRVAARIVVNCAGLYADRIARLAGQHVDFLVIPFMGIYYELLPRVRSLCRHLIYPVPDSSFPFLGVHFTRTIDGRIECGPNAVLAAGREAYALQQSSWEDIREIMAYRGFRRLAMRHWRKGFDELARTASKGLYLRELQRLIPSLTRSDIVRTRTGIRAQAVDGDGQLLEDFVIEESEKMISVCNAPSPAATACLRIGEIVAERVLGKLS